MKSALAKEILKTALVLVIIAGVAGALLGLVNHFAYVSDDELMARKASAVYDGQLEKRTGGGIGQAVQYENGKLLDVYYSKTEDNVFVLRVSGTGAYKGEVQLLVNITGGKIVKIATYEADETPGLGGKALQESYFQKYYGVSLAGNGGFTLVKSAPVSDGEVKAVTGASKSSTAVTNAVNVAVKWYNAVIVGGAD